LDDPGNGDDLVAADDEGPAFTVRAGDLRVDEHVLDLLRAAGESIARAPASYLKPWDLRLDAPRAPLDGAGREVDRAALEPQAVVLADGLRAAAEVDALRPGRGVEQLCEGPRGGAPPPGR